MGLHCSDCAYASFTYHEDAGMYQGSCSRGYTLTNPHVHTSPEDHFAETPDGLVPTIDPFGAEYLRTSNVCERFLLPRNAHGAPHRHEGLFHRHGEKNA